MIRVQRLRTKGWTMPEGALYVGRGTRWGNPYRVGRNQWYGSAAFLSREAAVAQFRRTLDGWLVADPAILDPLRDATALACWCRLDDVCHADAIIAALERAKPV